VAPFRVHHNDHKAKTVLDWVRHVQVWQVHDLVLFALVLQRVLEDNVLQQLEQAREITHHVLVERHQHKVHIVHKVRQLVERQVVQRVQVAAVLTAAQDVAVLQVHLERMQANLQSVSKSHVKFYVKSSTICKHRSWVAQLFRTEMVQPKSVCAVVHPLQISLRELAQIQQR
jgi:ribosomal protein S25